MSNVGKDGELSPKFKAMIENIENSKRPNLVYSNFIDSGVEPLAQELMDRGKRVGTFTGQLNDLQKKELVERYNRGMLDALLVSSAGAEGLDLKGTGAVHIAEPHWNDPKINQVIGRSARFNSHSHLPEKDRNVEVFRYISKD
jgi:superfamily II DNA/RNA helicase